MGEWEMEFRLWQINEIKQKEELPGATVIARSSLNHYFASVQEIGHDAGVCVGADD